MKRYVLLLLAICNILIGCGKEYMDNPSSDAVVVRVSIRPDRLYTRTVDESTIADINFFLYQPGKTQPAVHIYSQQPDLQFECPAGYYDMLVIANTGLDLGEMPYEMAIAYEATLPAADGCMMMTARRDIVIEASPATVTLEPIEVVRVAAKISYKIAVASQCADIRVRGVQVINMPMRTEVFAEGMPAAGYIDGDFTENPNVEGAVDGSFYMLPNLRGEVSSIADQTQKNEDNAPESATYLLIHAMRGTKVLSYRIYFGGNNSSDFNVRPNTHYTLDITIRGDNESDVRVSSYTVDVQCTPTAEEPICFLSTHTPILLSLTLGGEYQESPIHATLELKTGNPAYFRFEGKWDDTIHPISITGGENYYDILYLPPSFAREHARFSFTVRIYDQYGEIESFDFDYCYAHTVRIYTKWFDGSQGKGIVTSPDAWHIAEGSTLSSWYYDIYYPDEGCLLTAIPNDGYVFDGWCKSYDHVGELSYNENLQYDPLTMPDEIYAFFR